jgi:hypothetical protein
VKIVLDTTILVRANERRVAVYSRPTPASTTWWVASGSAL